MLNRKFWIRTPAVLLAAVLAIAFVAAQTEKAAHPTVVMETSMGTIKIEVFTDKAPVTARNFINYVKAGFYDNTIFHRVIPGFVVQGGGYLANMSPKPTMKPIKNESKNGLKNTRGSLSMARYNDPDSATSQFFINLVNNTSLDANNGGFGYAVFAKVIAGMDVVDRIAKVNTATKNVQGTPFGDVPVTPVIVKSAKVVE